MTTLSTPLSNGMIRIDWYGKPGTVVRGFYTSAGITVPSVIWDSQDQAMRCLTDMRRAALAYENIKHKHWGYTAEYDQALREDGLLRDDIFSRLGPK